MSECLPPFIDKLHRWHVCLATFCQWLCHIDIDHACIHGCVWVSRLVVILLMMMNIVIRFCSAEERMFLPLLYLVWHSSPSTFHHRGNHFSTVLLSLYYGNPLLSYSSAGGVSVALFATTLSYNNTRIAMYDAVLAHIYICFLSSHGPCICLFIT